MLIIYRTKDRVIFLDKRVHLFPPYCTGQFITLMDNNMDEKIFKIIEISWEVSLINTVCNVIVEPV